MRKFGVEYRVNKWRLFIDSSKRSLKAVLLHDGNNYEYASLSIGQPVHLKEGYENLELVLTKIIHTTHGWMIYGDLKVLCMLLGQQVDYSKYPCFMCEWDSTVRSQHWEQEHFAQKPCQSQENTATTTSY
jgi:hypothetical protein